MVAKRPKIVIIGAGMAGLTAAHRLYTTPGVKDMFDLCIVEGGNRIGGRINTTEFGGDRIEMGATYIHGIGGSPVYEIAQKINSLQSNQNWECMDGIVDDKIPMAETRTENGYLVNPSIVNPISDLFDSLMCSAQTKVDEGRPKMTSIGSFLRHEFDQYWGNKKDEEDVKICGNWSKKKVEEAVFSVHENTQRTYTGAGDLFNLDYAAESEYELFPGKEITIPRGYTTIIEDLASVLPPGLILLGKKVGKIEWERDGYYKCVGSEMNHTRSSGKPVKLHFIDGLVMEADHVIVTVSLGVLKAGIQEGSTLFSPSLPSMKVDAISRLGYGVVNKLFLQFNTTNHGKFPFLQLLFHRPDSEFRNRKLPWWLRRTAAFYPIYETSNVLLSWYAGKEALELETLDDEEIINGVSKTVSSFMSKSNDGVENGYVGDSKSEYEFKQVLKSKWGTDPLFLGSYSYVAVGSSGDDFDSLAKPLPLPDGGGSNNVEVHQPLQILFAGEATHRTHYSTTHGAYFSGLREADRLLQHYHL